ncbi:hypothetical protein MKZ26_20160 [Sporosarcina sp. FSL K6-6792]|uniref:hypothetical protein n=1 Tax=Sporosarcina sp. FSL K6-6792 TaxID=2921559 RepID=UPI0030F5CAFE
MIPIHFNTKKTSSYSIHTGSMTAHAQTSDSYSRQKEEIDRGRHFGILPTESIKTEDNQTE